MSVSERLMCALPVQRATVRSSSAAAASSARDRSRFDGIRHATVLHDDTCPARDAQSSIAIVTTTTEPEKR